MQRIERRHSKPDDNEIKCLEVDLMTCGNSSVGRARPCQGRGREFESRFPLQIKDMRSSGCQLEKFYGALAKRLCSGLQGLLNASMEEIAKVPGISQGLAEKIYYSLKH